MTSLFQTLGPEEPNDTYTSGTFVTRAIQKYNVGNIKMEFDHFLVWVVTKNMTQGKNR